MDYNFTYTMSMNDNNNNEIIIFGNGADYLYSYDYNSSLDFIEQKMTIDYNVYNYANRTGHTIVYGYALITDNGDSVFLNLTDKCSYFALRNNTNGNTYVITGYKLDYGNVDFSYNGYCKQLESPQERFVLNEEYYYSIDDYSIDSTYPYYSFLYDYRLSDSNSTYLIRGENIYSRMDFFYIDTGADSLQNITFSCGFDTTANADYERGYQAGLESGTVTGRQEGYAQGKADGLAQGRLEGGDYSTAMDWVGNGVQQLMPIFNLQVLPNISLGTVISIPIIIGLITIIFKISKG